jgi:hypothetical protein
MPDHVVPLSAPLLFWITHAPARVVTSLGVSVRLPLPSAWTTPVDGLVDPDPVPPYVTVSRGRTEAVEASSEWYLR